MEAPPSKLHDRITAKMTELELSIEYVAFKCGVSSQAVRNWMSGTRPRDEKLYPLAKTLRMKLSELLGAE